MLSLSLSRQESLRDAGIGALKFGAVRKVESDLIITSNQRGSPEWCNRGLDTSQKYLDSGDKSDGSEKWTVARNGHGKGQVSNSNEGVEKFSKKRVAPCALPELQEKCT